MPKQLQKLTANFSSLIRHDKLEGRDHLVVPMIMITEGVHEGSDGPLYYPADELRKFTAAWNQKPVVVYHPSDSSGEGMSACEPEVINNRKIGVIMNTKYKKGKGDVPGKLHAEAWLEVSRIEAVDRRVLVALESDEITELSTGLFTDNEDTPGEWNGEEYDSIARNYRPDHLAILPDQYGACSVADGAGLLRLNSRSKAVRDKLKENSFGDRRNRRYPITDQEDVDSASFLARNASEKVKTRIANLAKKKGLAPPKFGIKTNSKKKIVTNELSFGDITSDLCGLVVEAHGDRAWVNEVYDTYFVWRMGEDYYEQSYSLKGNDVQLVGEPTEVRRIVKYIPVVDTPAGNSSNKSKETEMTKSERVDHLIKNAGWAEGERDFLTKLSDERLEKLMGDGSIKQNQEGTPAPVVAPVVTPAPVPAPVVNTTVTTPAPAAPVTVDQYIAQAPAGLRGMLTNGVNSYNAQKAGVIGTITANKQNRFTPAQLDAKDLDELNNIAALLPQVDAQGNPTTNYAGAAGGPPTTNAAAPTHNVQALALPTWEVEAPKK